eukprot:m.37323 g.37323  ORF g.37323 m.37323 type:complete len:141 (-) comp5438_c0_seq2:42-464(-)
MGIGSGVFHTGEARLRLIKLEGCIMMEIDFKTRMLLALTDIFALRPMRELLPGHFRGLRFLGRLGCIFHLHLSDRFCPHLLESAFANPESVCTMPCIASFSLHRISHLLAVLEPSPLFLRTRIWSTSSHDGSYKWYLTVE